MPAKLQVIVRQRRWTTGTSFAVDRSRTDRTWIERLEARVLLAAGDYDSSFGGGDGMVSGTRVAGDLLEARRVLPQSDGSLLVDIGPLWGDPDLGASRFVARVDAKGQLDRAFGEDGLRPLSDAIPAAAAPKDVSAGHVEVQRAGRLLLATAVSENRKTGASTLSLTRLNADGSIDLTFGRSGTVTVPLPAHPNSTAAVRGTVEDSAGRTIVAVSIRERALSQRSFVYLIAFRPNGTIDSSWANGGMLNVAPPGGDGFFGTLIRDRFGHLVMSGYTSAADGSTQAAIARLLPDGQPDSRFADDGWLITNLGKSSAQFGQPSVDSQARVLAYFARIDHGVDERLEVGAVRVNFNGAVDQSFHAPGDLVDLQYVNDETADYFRSVFIQPDDKPILNYGLGWLQRVNVNGSPDESFSDDSWVWSWHSYIGGDGNPAAFVNGQIVIAGITYEDVTIDGKDVFLCSWGVELMDAGIVLTAAPASIPVLEAPPIVVLPRYDVRSFDVGKTASLTSFATDIIDAKLNHDLLAPTNELI